VDNSFNVLVSSAENDVYSSPLLVEEGVVVVNEELTMNILNVEKVLAVETVGLATVGKTLLAGVESLLPSAIEKKEN